MYKDILNHDSTHKYWIIKIDDKIVGIVYIYGYSYRYKKCSLGFGLLPSYRGNKQSTKIVNKFCDFLHQSYNIIRIQVDIEAENKTCIKWFDKYHNDMGFTYECDANNYQGEGVTVKIYSNCSTK